MIVLWAGIAIFGIACVVAQVEPPPAAVCGIGEAAQQEIGEKTYVCVTINGRRRALFTPKLDDFSLFTISNSADALPDGSGYYEVGGGWVSDGRAGSSYAIAFDVQSFSARSRSKVFVEFTNSSAGVVSITKRINVYTALIQMVDGVVESVTFDEGCDLCDGKGCVANQFNATAGSLDQDSGFRSCETLADECGEGNENCDLKLYVGWTGTDGNGNFLQSANLRLSRFTQFGIQNAFEQSRDDVEAGAREARGEASNQFNRV